jgi:hypothetical protein
MVNTCERLINVVRVNKPKMLTGLSQKALRRVEEVPLLLSWTQKRRRRRKRTCPILLSLWNMVSPSLSHMGRQPQGRPKERWVKESGESEGHPVTGWIEGATSPRAKASRLPLSLS